MLVDFRGNEYGVGDTIVYAPTNRYAGLVEAEVIEIGPVKMDINKAVWIEVRPSIEANWHGAPSKRDGRRTKLTNFHRVMKVNADDA